MDNIKENVCDCLKLNKNRLHEIELEDIQLTPPIQKNIYKTIANIFTADAVLAADFTNPFPPLSDITCKGYWVENTKELVLYVWMGDQSKAIIIPQTGWFMKANIVVH